MRHNEHRPGRCQLGISQFIPNASVYIFLRFVYFVQLFLFSIHLFYLLSRAPANQPTNRGISVIIIFSVLSSEKFKSILQFSKSFILQYFAAPLPANRVFIYYLFCQRRIKVKCIEFSINWINNKIGLNFLFPYFSSSMYFFNCVLLLWWWA